MIDEGADLRVQEAARRIHRVHVEHRQPVVRQHAHEPPAAQVVDRRIDRQRTDAQPRAQRDRQRLRRIRVERRGRDRMRRGLAAGAMQQPFVVHFGRRIEAQAGMACQVGGRGRHTVAGEVGRRRDQHAEGRAARMRDARGVRQARGRDDRYVVALLDEIGHPLRIGHLDGDVGKARPIGDGRRGDMALPEAGHRMHAQASVRADQRAPRLGVRLVDIAEDRLQALEIAASAIGQRDFPGGPVQQTNLRIRFQARDGPRHLGGRDIGLLRHGGEAAGLHDANERPHVLEHVHFDSSSSPVLHPRDAPTGRGDAFGAPIVGPSPPRLQPPDRGAEG